MTDTTPIVKQGIHDAFRKCQNVLENEVSLISEDLKYLENSHAQVLEEYAQLSQKTAQLIADQAQESQRREIDGDLDKRLTDIEDRVSDFEATVKELDEYTFMIETWVNQNARWALSPKS